MSPTKLPVVSIPIKTQFTGSPSTERSHSTDSLTKPSNADTHEIKLNPTPRKEVPSSSPDELLMSVSLSETPVEISNNPRKRTSRKLESSSSIETSHNQNHEQTALETQRSRSPIVTQESSVETNIIKSDTIDSIPVLAQPTIVPKSKLKLDSDDESGDDDFLLDFSKTLALKSSKL
jgi:hypothetical protein